jgi:hypothetical protein
MTQTSAAALLTAALRLLLPLSAVLTTYLYLYPVFHGCAFPVPGDGIPADERWRAFAATAALHLPNGTVAAGTKLAPFRLLALGDPQLEGDTSIPNAYGSSFPHLRSLLEQAAFRTEHTSLLQRVRQIAHDGVDFWLDDIPNTIESIRKRVDLFGNDFYLAHIVRSVRWWTKPTHTTVLGDLVGSQWVSDDEFALRASRFWNRVMSPGGRVPDDLAMHPADEYDLSGFLGNGTDAWVQRVINVVGNHDIGYAGDINAERLERFESAFGKSNYELRFELHPSLLTPGYQSGVYDLIKNRSSDRLLPELRIVNINSMVLDTPAQSAEIQDIVYAFLNSAINTASAVEYKGHFTLILTHVPLYKPEGVCVDSPYFNFHEDTTLAEQNQLSADASRGFLEGILGMHSNPNAAAAGLGRRGIILNGHDHEGCDTYHFVNQHSTNRTWEAMRYAPARDGGIVGKPGHPGVREVTVRSMMGDFGGNAGLLSVWFDEQRWEWRAEYDTCALGRQHLWWAVHVIDLMAVGCVFAVAVLTVLPAAGPKTLALDVRPLEKRPAAAPRTDPTPKPVVRSGLVRQTSATPSESSGSMSFSGSEI